MPNLRELTSFGKYKIIFKYSLKPLYRLPAVMGCFFIHTKNKIMDLKIKNKQAFFTVEFQIDCVKCGKQFESIAVKKGTAPTKHTAKCPSCNTKHLWNGNS